MQTSELSLPKSWSIYTIQGLGVGALAVWSISIQIPDSQNIYMESESINSCKIVQKISNTFCRWHQPHNVTNQP